MAYLSVAFPWQPADRLHPSLSTDPRRPAARRIRLAARGQARRLPDHCRKEGPRAIIWTRHGTNFTDRLPKIAEAVRRLPVDRALIDGEAVAFRPDGHSDFAALRTKADSLRASLVAFDLLTLDDNDYRQRPLEGRREALSRLSSVQRNAQAAGSNARR